VGTWEQWTEAEIPETNYAKTVDGVHIAYQVLGTGPIDLVLVGWLTNLEHIWRWPRGASFFRGLTGGTRLIMLDRRGTGASDHTIDAAQAMPLDARMDDIRAVMDAAGSERAVIFGVEDGFAVAALFAATYPERTAALMAFGATARVAWAPDYPDGRPWEEYREEIAEVERSWGTRVLAEAWIPYVFPDDIDDEAAIRFYASWMRGGGGPGDAASWYGVSWETDVREILPTIRVPTLVLHRVGDRAVPIANGRYIAEHIPGATLVELSGAAHGPPAGTDVAEAVRDFLIELRREEAELDRVLATVLFTDIVNSTAAGAAMGDRAWTELRGQHDRVVRANLARFRGREIKTMGDGFLATFDGPARGVRCAEAIATGVKPLGIEIRAGLHTGEVALDGDDVAGLGVTIGARVGAMAGASEVLVSQTVKDLVAGSGLTFEDAGEHELKGVPGRWHLYRVVG
jgi:class 3 adenylate cyclase